MTAEGTLVTVDTRPALRFERRYPHPVERVWRAVSDPAEMMRWFPAAVEGDRAVGAELVFVDDAQRAAAQAAGEPTRDDGGPLIRGVVTAYDPPRLFAFTWGGELIRLELAPDGDATTLVFTQVLSDTSVAARNGAGWHMCLAELDALLDGPAAAPGGDGWEAVYDDYLDRMGPPLGVRSRDGAMTWERSTHVGPDRVREVLVDPAAWGAGERAGEGVRWEVEPAEDGTRYRATHPTAGADPALAAAWHGLLVQLDMYLAASTLVPVDAGRWVPAYGEATGG
jgi:uncharacterized protein YndB with AHSA1/START domain